METIFEKIKRKNTYHRRYVESLDVLDVKGSMFCFVQNDLVVELINARYVGIASHRLGDDGGIYTTFPGAEIESPDDIQNMAKEALANMVNLPASDLLTRAIETKQDLLDFLEQADKITAKLP